MKLSPLDKIVEQNRMPILFIGSGISKRYLYNFPDWNTLLKNSFKFFSEDEYYYLSILEEEKRNEKSDFEIFQKLGTIAENEFNRAFFSKKIAPFKSTKWLSQNISPYKMYIAMSLKKKKIKSNDNLMQQEIAAFKNLKNKISAVITTNYDTFLEDEIFNDDFTVFTRQEQLFSNKSFNIAEIYKIHGCIKDASSIIITERDYKNFKDSRKLFIAKMLTLFAESPIIFLGYSLTDENIKIIIEDFLTCLSNENLENIEDHFIFVNYKPNEHEFIYKTQIITGDKKNIPYTVLETDNFLGLFLKLNDITPSLPAKRVRDVKKVIKGIVDSSVQSKKPESYIIGIDNLDKIETDKPLAIALGYREALMGYTGYKLISTREIFEDILYNNKEFNNKNMCLTRFKSIPINHLYPVFKYIKNTPEYEQNLKLKKYVDTKNSEDKIISKNFLKSLKNYENIPDFKSLKNRINSEPNIRKKVRFY